MASINANGRGSVRKPELVTKIDCVNERVLSAVLIPHEDGVITISEDRFIRVWLKRDTGQYWPSICSPVKAEPSCLFFNEPTRRLFVGLDSGTIAEFYIEADYNRMTPTKYYPAHKGRVTDLIFAKEKEWLLSCSRDRWFHWYCSETGRHLGAYETTAWCTCLQFDVRSQYVFIGDYSGKVSVLKISSSGSELITTLRGHSGSVRCLAWNEDRSMLFSGSFDQSIIVWDIGGQQGSAFELHGHRDKVQAVLYIDKSKQLISTGDDGVLAFWDMGVTREETPEWAESDHCQKCSSPFFWNFKTMWESKTVGVRQHHCRKCGGAICDKCSEKRSRLPKMGYEYDVRVCNSCFDEVTPEDRAPLATFHDGKHSVLAASVDIDKSLLLTIGKDRILKIWDISSVLH